MESVLRVQKVNMEKIDGSLIMEKPNVCLYICVGICMCTYLCVCSVGE